MRGWFTTVGLGLSMALWTPDLRAGDGSDGSPVRQGQETAMGTTWTIRVEAKVTPLVRKTLFILTRELRERGGIQATEIAGGAADLTLAISPGIGVEGFRLDGDGVKTPKRIVGNDERGLLYGVGRYLRGCTFGETPAGFRHNPWAGVSVPRRPVRGIYWATHFHNFYHDAPMDEVRRYLEDLSLWGCNALSVWFDMHHFKGIDDPAAQAMIRRLREILRAANEVGMSGGLTALANEGYANSPPALRADWTAGHDGYFAPPGGHYHVEICPSKPGGTERILADREAMLRAFADLKIEYVWNWPYDQGGCTCRDCAPWGANGFLRLARPYAETVRKVMPNAKIVLSTWYFDHFIAGEWERFSAALGTRKPDFAEYLMVDDNGNRFPEYPLAHGAPGGLPMLNFAEISMYKMFPWGGYGANPLPRHIQAVWNQAGDRLAGGFPYSEGIFEDVNKAICLMHYWGDRDSVETAREYAASVASPELADELTQALLWMEDDHEHFLQDVHAKDAAGNAADRSDAPVLVKVGPMPHAKDCRAKMNGIASRLTSQARSSWRWRMLWLRSEIDAALAASAGRWTPELDALWGQVTDISHVQGGDNRVSPPNRAALTRWRP